MWKQLDSGEIVQMGDIVRYRPGLPHPAALDKMVFDVIKADQHYFVVAMKDDVESGDNHARTIIKYIDVGYNINLEIWSAKGHGMA
jgi:hypothetical protein